MHQRLASNGCSGTPARRASERQRTLLDVGRVLGRRLQEGDAPLVGEGFCLVKLDLPFAVHIALVADEQLVDVFARVTVDLAQPLLHIVKRFPVGDVVDDDDAVRTAVVAASDRPEALLASSIPDLQLYSLTIQVNRADLKVHTNSANVRLSVRVVGCDMAAGWGAGERGSDWARRKRGSGARGARARARTHQNAAASSSCPHQSRQSAKAARNGQGKRKGTVEYAVPRERIKGQIFINVDRPPRGLSLAIARESSLQLRVHRF